MTVTVERSRINTILKELMRTYHFVQDDPAGKGSQLMQAAVNNKSIYEGCLMPVRSESHLHVVSQDPIDSAKIVLGATVSGYIVDVLHFLSCHGSGNGLRTQDLNGCQIDPSWYGLRRDYLEKECLGLLARINSRHEVMSEALDRGNWKPIKEFWLSRITKPLPLVADGSMPYPLRRTYHDFRMARYETDMRMFDFNRTKAIVNSIPDQLAFHPQMLDESLRGLLR